MFLRDVDSGELIDEQVASDGGINAVEKTVDRENFWDQVLDLCTDAEAIVLTLVLYGWDVGQIMAHMEWNSPGTYSNMMARIIVKAREVAAGEGIELSDLIEL